MLTEKELEEKLKEWEVNQELIKLEMEVEEIKKILNSNHQDRMFEYINDKLISYIGLSNLEDMIIATKNIKLITRFAIEISNINIEKLEQSVIDLVNSEYAYRFARDIKGANIKKFEDIILSEENIEKSAEYIYYFTRDVKGANIKRLEDAIIKTKNIYFIMLFAENIKGITLEKFEDVIIETKNPYYLYYLAKKVKGVNIEKIENALMETMNVEYISKFADIKGANLFKIYYVLKSMNKNNECELIYKKIFSDDNDLKCIHNSNKAYALQNLIEYRNENNNEIKLRIYFNYLFDVNSKESELVNYDHEYVEYMCSLEKEKMNNTSNQKVKKYN